MKYILSILLICLIISCKSPTERWLAGLASYQEVHSTSLSLEILRMQDTGDTTTINYRVRLRPSSKVGILPDEQYDLDYKMDSSFFLRSGGKTHLAELVEAVPNGIKGCHEYLLSFTVDQRMKSKSLDLVYQDKFLDGKPYIISLNK